MSGELGAVADGVCLPAIRAALAAGDVVPGPQRDYLEELVAAQGDRVEQTWIGVKFSEAELLALAASLDGQKASGDLGGALSKVSSAAMDIIHGSRASRRAVKKL